MPDTTRPAEVFPPGEFVREELAARGWSQTDIAVIMGCAPRTVSEIIKGRRGLSPKTAVALGAAFGTSADFWLNLEPAKRMSRRVRPRPPAGT